MYTLKSKGVNYSYYFENVWPAEISSESYVSRKHIIYNIQSWQRKARA